MLYMNIAPVCVAKKPVARRSGPEALTNRGEAVMTGMPPCEYPYCQNETAKAKTQRASFAKFLPYSCRMYKRRLDIETLCQKRAVSPMCTSSYCMSILFFCFCFFTQDRRATQVEWSTRWCVDLGCGSGPECPLHRTQRHH